MNLRGKIVTLLDPGIILGLGKSVQIKGEPGFYY